MYLDDGIPANADDVDFGAGFSATVCPYCGEPQHVELAEIWGGGHEFWIATCCQALHEELVWEMQDPEYRMQLLRRLGAEEYIGADLRRVADNDGQLILDYELRIRPIRFGQAKAFVARWHQHCPAPVAWRFGASIWNGGTMLGVVCVGRPVARAIDQINVVEVNRLCLNLSLPDALRWRACSTLYSWAADEAQRRGFTKIITYTLQSESGMSLRYARWRPEAVTRARSWNSRSRARIDKTPIVPKVRWSRTLRPAVTALQATLAA